MRLIDADAFIENVSSGLYVYLQADSQDVIDAVNCEPTFDLMGHINKRLEDSGVLDSIVCTRDYSKEN